MFSQMKITQLKGFTPAEIAAYKAQVHGNVLTNIRLLIKGAEQLGIQLDDPVRAQRSVDLTCVLRQPPPSWPIRTR